MQDTQEKPEAEPHPWLVFQDFVRKILAVPKAEIDAEEAKRKARAAKRKKRRPSR